MPAILTKIREQASRVQPTLALGVGVGVALAACALYQTRERKQPPPCQNNNNYKVARNGKLQTVTNGQANAETCGGRCGAEQCALCRGDADTDNKQNIEDADEPTPTTEEHVPGLNLEFLRQLVTLAKIMVPGFRSHEVALLTAHTLCLFSRTFLSIYVASLEGSIVRHIVQKDLNRFSALLMQWIGIAVPATFINSMIRYLEGRLALAFRTRLVNHAYELYFKNQTYYRVANLDARIENADHRLTEDVSVFAQSVAHLYSSLTKPCFDLLLIVLTLASYSSKMKGNIFIGPGIATCVICITGLVLRLLSPRFGALAGEEARMKAKLRHAHARLIAHAEEVAFYGGHKVEHGQLQTAYKELVGQMTCVFNKKLWYVMLEQFCMKYVWSGTGMVMLALPILTGTRDGSGAESISARTEYMTTSRNLLNSAADAIERLMSSYKEVVTLAGYATRVSDMLKVFGEVARGRCVRDVHVAPSSHSAFQVTFKDKQPVPMGKLSYTNDLSIHLHNVPIVTPSCDVVASGVSLHIAPGTHLLIVGPNGCGKSSLFRIISGLWPVFGGALSVPKPCECPHCADEASLDTHLHCDSRPIMFYIPQSMGVYLCLFRIISGLWPVFGGALSVPKPCECPHCADEASLDTHLHCDSRPIMFYIPQSMGVYLCLFRIISGLWPVFGGALSVPKPCECPHCADEASLDTHLHCDSRPIMFYIPQRPYMSVGTLLDQVTYPARTHGPSAEARADYVLNLVNLGACAARHGGLHAERDWRATLSGGEKQRMAMARMFYHRPVYALLDECTSAVSMETEVVMYEAAVREGITLLSITHRPSVWKYHTHVLEFDGAGNWSFRPLDKEAQTVSTLPTATTSTTLAITSAPETAISVQN